MPLAEIEEFKKLAEPNFYKPVFSAFNFLVNEYGFYSMGSAISYETSIVYSYKDVNIVVFHAFPEIPCLILRRNDSGKTVEERLVKKVNTSSAKKAAATLKKARDKMNIDEWLKSFRAGDFNPPIHDILYEYAQLVRANISRILEGDFKFSNN